MHTFKIQFADADNTDLSDVQDAVSGIAQVQGWASGDAVLFTSELTAVAVAAELTKVGCQVTVLA